MEGTPLEKKENGSEKERGANVCITLKFMRHGERDKQGRLIDLGRGITAKNAQALGIESGDYDLIKAIGSNVGPTSTISTQDVRGDIEVGRALETAHIYAEALPGKKGNPRARSILAYDTIKSPVPYDHLAVYNANLPPNFENLEGEERVQAAARAQDAVMAHLERLNTPEAQAYKKEVAGAFAHTILHYADMVKRLKSDSRVLVPAGSHGGMMEFLLHYALTKKTEDGDVKVEGADIGGGLMPSEAFTVNVETDEHGELKQFTFSFDDSSRPLHEQELVLDRNTLEELSRFYTTLHEE